MEPNLSRIQALVDRPSESLSVELKRWIDPDHPEGVAKIVRAALALRNHNGGYLVIGFDNETLQPDKKGAPADVRHTFHIDKIQGIVSRFASEPFEVAVDFAERDGHAYPVISIPPGIKTPVVAKADLPLGNDRLIATNDVYVRSLRANNTPSTAKASWKDWPDLVEMCFDNREADIGRFLRRHLGSLSPATMRDLLESLGAAVAPQAPPEELVRAYLEQSGERFRTAVQERGTTVPPHGAWEAALVVVGANDLLNHSANLAFLHLVDSANPDYSGWPVWLNSREFSDKESRPYIADGAWEALLINVEADFLDHIDFIRLDPTGRFYHRRALQDDLPHAQRRLVPLTVLDFGLPIVRTAEAIAVGIAFAKAMGFKEHETQLAFAFRWTKLHGRELTSWAQPGRYIAPGRTAYQDEVVTSVIVPLETPLSAVPEFVHQALEPLFEVFDGFQISKEIVGELTRRLLDRKL